MTHVTDDAMGDGRPNDVPQLPEESAAVESVEAYRTSDGVVLYDAKNPLAWVKSNDAVSLGDRL